jgi:hypothetical protein
LIQVPQVVDALPGDDEEHRSQQTKRRTQSNPEIETLHDFTARSFSSGDKGAFMGFIFYSI